MESQRHLRLGRFVPSFLVFAGFSAGYFWGIDQRHFSFLILFFSLISWVFLNDTKDKEPLKNEERPYYDEQEKMLAVKKAEEERQKEIDKAIHESYGPCEDCGSMDWMKANQNPVGKFIQCDKCHRWDEELKRLVRIN